MQETRARKAARGKARGPSGSLLSRTATTRGSRGSRRMHFHHGPRCGCFCATGEGAVQGIHSSSRSRLMRSRRLGGHGRGPDQAVQADQLTNSVRYATGIVVKMCPSGQEDGAVEPQDDQLVELRISASSWNFYGWAFLLWLLGVVLAAFYWGLETVVLI